MKADTVDLATIFGNQVRYVVPLYQRPYVWTREDQWEPLWQDVQAVADRQLDDIPANDSIPHFLGAVVLEQALVPSGKVNSRSVIDGQQRLTTLQLLLAAARSIADEHGLEDSTRTIEKLLLNESFLVKHDGFEFKVMPTERDRVAFAEAMRDSMGAATGSHRIHHAYRYFRDAIAAWLLERPAEETIADRMDALVTVLWKHLIVVTIDLDPGDNAQVIFETLNARGTPLLAGDLIKNHLFQVATTQGAAIDALYESHWRALDTEWWRTEVQQGRLMRPRLDAFLMHWLAMRTRAEVVSHELFLAFKRYLAGSGRSAEEVLADITRYATVYESFETAPPDKPLGRFLYRLRAMELTTAYPTLLWLLGPEGMEDQGDQRAALDAIESWLVRRMLVRATTKNYNVVFLSILKAIGDDLGTDQAPRTTVAAFLADLKGESQEWPSDESVLASLRVLPVYRALTRGRLRMVLEALESSMYTGMTEKVTVQQDLTIEHVLPQEWGAHWPLPEGIDPAAARTEREAAKHTLGNLTLVTGKLNPKLSNGPWPEKRSALRTHSIMRISTDLRDADHWDEVAIATRGERLARQVLAVWPRPDSGAPDDGLVDSKHVADGTGRPAPLAVPVLVGGADGFEAPLAIADAVGVGRELREIVSVTRKVGLHPRADKYCVMVTPPSDRRVMLFTVWPQADLDGSFRIWTSPAAFARAFPGTSLDEARSVLGESDGAGVLRAADVPRFLKALRDLVPDLATVDRSAVPGQGTRDEVLEGVQRVIDLRAGPWVSPLARQFAEDALGRDGVELRLQRSKHDNPWYFQVRHPRFGQVVAYVNPRPNEVRIDYRLPSDAETYGVAQSRDTFYGISLSVTQPEGLSVANQLLTDALNRID